MRNKKGGWILPTIIVIALFAVGVGAVFYFGGSPQQFIETNLHGPEGDSLSLSVVGGVEGVAFVSFDVNIENLDSVDLTFFVDGMTPMEIEGAIPSSRLTIPSGQSGTITTGLIDIQPFEGTLQEFCITVISDPVAALRESASRTGCVSLDIQPNPEGEFDVTVDSDAQDPGQNPGCVENWECSEWGTCSNSLQTRTCTDLNDCGTNQNRPDEEQFCEGAEAFQTNAVNGDYDDSNVWIIVNDITYDHSGRSSYGCDMAGAEIILYTPEGLPVCSRNGYAVSERVYLDDGSNGLIFKT